MQPLYATFKNKHTAIAPVKSCMPLSKAALHAFFVYTGGTLLESQVQADVISADEEALLDDWLIADEDCTAAGRHS